MIIFTGCDTQTDDAQYREAYRIYPDYPDSALVILYDYLEADLNDKQAYNTQYLIAYIYDINEHLSEAVKMYAQIIEDHGASSLLYKNIGRCYWLAGEFNLALESLLLAKEEDENDPVIDYNLGLVYRDMGSTQTGETYLYEALSTFESTADQKMIAWCRTELGILYRRIGLYEEARENYFYVLNQSNELDSGLKASSLNNIANTYYYEKEYDLALEYFERSLAFQADKRVQAPTLRRIGELRRKKGDMSGAKYAYLSVIQNGSRLNDFDDEIESISQLASLYVQIGKIDSAQYYISMLTRSSVELMKKKEALVDASEASTYRQRIIQRKRKTQKN